jgi:hypothetical protein
VQDSDEFRIEYTITRRRAGEAEDEPAYPTFSTYGDKHAVLDRVPGDRP